MKTKNQTMAQKAFEVVNGQNFGSFAREFPTLVHSCGLAQAFVYAKAKNEKAYREALAKVLKAAKWAEAENDAILETKMLGMSVSTYIRLSRDALAAAVWIKRYCEAEGKADAE